MTLSDTSFEKTLASFNLDTTQRWAVAVSGGADSLCLTLLLHQFCQKNKIELFAITVDHNIRSESAQEAETVHNFLKKQNIQHTILKNTTPIGNTCIEEDARNIRYNLLTSFCKENNIPYLFIAHQLEDQIETFLSRLARGSGINGLGAIKKISQRDDIVIIRPFLNTPKNEIKKYLSKNNIEWVEDPMNQDPNYERVKWRNFLPVLEKNNLSLKAISLSIQRLNRVQETLNTITNTFLKTNVSFYPEGYALINTNSFQTLPDEIKIRALNEVLKKIGQSEKIISLELLERLIHQLPKKNEFSKLFSRTT